MTPDAEQEALRWLQEAQADWEAASDLLKSRRYNWACFVAQRNGLSG